MIDDHDSNFKYELAKAKNGENLSPVMKHVSLNGQSEKKHERSLKNVLPQILATCAKNLLLLSYGMTLGISAIAIPALDAERPNITKPDLQKDILSLSKTEISWFSSINLICVPLGCFASGAVTQPLGRKKSMMLLNIPFLIVWLLYYNASNVITMYTALIISGLAGGLHEAPVLTYVAEITEPHLRGILGATAPTTVIVGTVSQLVMGTFYHWRTVVLINMFFPILAFTALQFVPESPHWLINKGRYKEAEKSLCWLRGWVHPDVVQQELSTLKKVIRITSSSKKVSIKETFQNYKLRTFIVPHLIIMVTFFVGQFGGMMSLQTNAIQLFRELGTKTIDEYTALLIFGVVEFLGAVLCVGLVHVTGKRVLLIATTITSAMCLFTLAVYNYFQALNKSAVDDQFPPENFSWIPVIFLNANAFFTHAGIRLLPWVLIGEVYPTDIRATATGASAFWFYVFAFLVNKSFGWMLKTLNLYGLLALYGSILFVGSLFFYIFLPETEGHALYAIERHFACKSNLFRTKIRPDLENEKNEEDNLNNFEEVVEN